MALRRPKALTNLSMKVVGSPRPPGASAFFPTVGAGGRSQFRWLGFVSQRSKELAVLFICLGKK